MPYIKEIERQALDSHIDYDTLFIDHPGNLNYLFTMLIIKYLEERGLTYTNVNEVVGVLECCKLELYRRLASPYEDVKIKENGDVY